MPYLDFIIVSNIHQYYIVMNKVYSFINFNNNNDCRVMRSRNIVYCRILMEVLWSRYKLFRESEHQHTS